MHTESKNYDFLMYTLNAGNQCHHYIPSTTVLGDIIYTTVCTLIFTIIYMCEDMGVSPNSVL